MTDTLLRLGRTDTYRPLWSDQVLDEVERNLPKIAPGVTPARAQRRVNIMRASFPDALVTDFEAMIPIADYCKPAVTIADFLSMLNETAPNFAAAIGPLLTRAARF